jgi:hypothetical protein
MQMCILDGRKYNKQTSGCGFFSSRYFRVVIRAKLGATGTRELRKAIYFLAAASFLPLPYQNKPCNIAVQTGIPGQMTGISEHTAQTSKVNVLASKL